MRVLIAKAFAVWLALLACAVVNGALREALLIPQLGTIAGLLLSGLLLCALILTVAYLALPWLDVSHRSQCIAVGLGWLCLTLAFEVSMGRLKGMSWPVLLEAYTFKDGNLWPVVLLATAAAPCLASQLRRAC